MPITSPFHEYVMAMERVERRLRRVTEALDAAGLRYAVIGGNAVAAWVATRNPSATRATKDVDLLVQRGDVDAITRVLAAIGFKREDLRSLTLFLDPEEPDRKSGVHLVWAAERVRPSSPHPTPSVDERVRPPDETFWVAKLPALLNLKLSDFRLKDQVHILDMLAVGLIDDAVRATLPPDLLARLLEIEAKRDEWE